jgi:CBS domain containing-hemolysin-like protein
LSQDKQPLALLIDEFGGTAGILTISDIADELIGGVEDIRQASEHSYIVKGETSISTLESILDIDLAPEERTYESVGGLVMAELDRMPSVGDTVTTKDGDLRVTAMRGRRVTEVRLTLAGNQQSPEESADG